MKKILIFALLILVLSGCVSDGIENTNLTDSETNEETEIQEEEEVNMSEVVQKGDRIKVDYKGTLEDGTEFDSSLKEGRTPLEFTAGAGQMIKGFDAAVIGMKVDEEKTVTLQPEDAYGTSEQSNHELAGKTLIFWIKIVEIQK